MYIKTYFVSYVILYGSSDTALHINDIKSKIIELNIEFAKSDDFLSRIADEIDPIRVVHIISLSEISF